MQLWNGIHFDNSDASHTDKAALLIKVVAARQQKVDNTEALPVAISHPDTATQETPPELEAITTQSDSADVEQASEDDDQAAKAEAGGTVGEELGELKSNIECPVAQEDAPPQVCAFATEPVTKRCLIFSVC